MWCFIESPIWPLACMKGMKFLCWSPAPMHTSNFNQMPCSSFYPSFLSLQKKWTARLLFLSIFVFVVFVDRTRSMHIMCSYLVASLVLPMNLKWILMFAHDLGMSLIPFQCPWYRKIIQAPLFPISSLRRKKKPLVFSPSWPPDGIWGSRHGSH